MLLALPFSGRIFHYLFAFGTIFVRHVCIRVPITRGAVCVLRCVYVLRSSCLSACFARALAEVGIDDLIVIVAHAASRLRAALCLPRCCWRLASGTAPGAFRRLPRLVNIGTHACVCILLLRFQLLLVLLIDLISFRCTFFFIVLRISTFRGG